MTASTVVTVWAAIDAGAAPYIKKHLKNFAELSSSEQNMPMASPALAPATALIANMPHWPIPDGIWMGAA
jgi:hypothetical protein